MNTKEKNYTISYTDKSGDNITVDVFKTDEAKEAEPVIKCLQSINKKYKDHTVKYNITFKIGDTIEKSDGELFNKEKYTYINFNHHKDNTSTRYECYIINNRLYEDKIVNNISNKSNYPLNNRYILDVNFLLGSITYPKVKDVNDNEITIECLMENFFTTNTIDYRREVTTLKFDMKTGTLKESSVSREYKRGDVSSSYTFNYTYNFNEINIDPKSNDELNKY